MPEAWCLTAPQKDKNKAGHPLDKNPRPKGNMKFKHTVHGGRRFNVHSLYLIQTFHGTKQILQKRFICETESNGTGNQQCPTLQH